MRELARAGSAAAAAPSESARRLLLPLVLLALLVHAVGASSVCDTANCGKGNCSETSLLPKFECRCDPGWSHALPLIPFSPCVVPHCSFNSACLNLSLSQPPKNPQLSVCSIVSCGAGGDCKPRGDPLSFSYTCECRQGYANLLNLTTLPCVNCFLGDACYALGLGPPPPATAPSGDHGPPSTPSAPPSPTNGNATNNSLGSVPSPSLVELLLMLVSVAMVQVG